MGRANVKFVVWRQSIGWMFIVQTWSLIPREDVPVWYRWYTVIYGDASHGQCCTRQACAVIFPAADHKTAVYLFGDRGTCVCVCVCVCVYVCVNKFPQSRLCSGYNCDATAIRPRRDFLAAYNSTQSSRNGVARRRLRGGRVAVAVENLPGAPKSS